MPGTYPLPTGDLKSLGFASKPLDHLDALIRSHIDEGRYPGAQIALARHGKLALFRTYGNARTEGTTIPATNDGWTSTTTLGFFRSSATPNTRTSPSPHVWIDI